MTVRNTKAINQLYKDLSYPECKWAQFFRISRGRFLSWKYDYVFGRIF